MKITIGRKQGEPLSFTANPDEKVLHAALRSRITVPYECATGTCGSCRAKLVSGELHNGWEEAPGTKALKISRGEFLMCQCAPQSDCEIRIPVAVSHAVNTQVPDLWSGTIGEFDKLTKDVMAFSVTLDRAVGFKAGQFMLLQLPGITGTRAYSMVNYASNTNKLEFVIKQVSGGQCSRWLFNPSREACDVSVFGPIGHAIFEPQLKHDLLLLAGGSGIAGMMAILQQADQTGYLDSHKVELIFGVRSTPDVFYSSALRELAQRYPDTLTITIALSESESDIDVRRLSKAVCGEVKNMNITGQGFVHEYIDESRITTNTMAFVAGPPPMVDGSLRKLITDCEFDVERIRYDKFA